MYCLTNNKVEHFKVSSIERSLDNKGYKINHRNTDFGDLHFDGDQSLIARRRLYHINNIIVFS